MLFMSRVSLIAVTVGLSVLGTTAHSQSSVFEAGDGYIFSLREGTSVEEEFVGATNKFFVENAQAPNIGAIYRGCASTAGYKRNVEAYAQLYSSHFKAVTLVQGRKMTNAQFSSAISCTKRAVEPVQRAVSTQTTWLGSVLRRASFGVSKIDLPTAQIGMAKCVSTSGYRKQAHIQVKRYTSDIVKISLIRSGSMSLKQYNAAITCSSKKIAAL